MFFTKEERVAQKVDENTTRILLAHGSGLMNALIIFEKGQDPDQPILLHRHQHVQTTYVLQGKFKFVIDEPDNYQEKIVQQGDAIYFPSDVLHGCLPLTDDARLLDSFTPEREDFL
ncbi:cupin domain-containing protein [Enterococcus timonensis]|uniref:cupin domain-containing protein n=1 Tax=Enterococcus timonensis TaxID=1852364 RepID=UPI0008DA9A17|nr:cupin domain-containing protein [Enterococcus timonensis]